MNFKKSQLFIEFPYIRLGNLKLLAQKIKFSVKILVSPPVCYLFLSAARGGRINRSPLGASLAVLV